ncbi:DMT family transporter [Limosilactobacillus viscerum]|uniref:DMT family transporter n=1 Tax=Limosilactobacillus viscerum TaxID=2993450 RepID=UPI0024BA9F8F|nr:multidrug efflux SMR transporter [Limosilactobacillus viscerum]
MAWLFLIIAGIFEAFWSTMMKLSNGFSNIYYSILTVVGMILSFAGLIIATKHLPLSLAYPVWTGIGAVGAILVGVLCFQEHLSLSTGIFTVMLLVGIIGIKITAGH